MNLFIKYFFSILIFSLSLDVAAQTPATSTDGRPPDAFAAKVDQQISCSCKNTKGTCVWRCTIPSSESTKSCLEVCVEQANKNCK